MFVADVFTKLPKGNVRVSVSDSSHRGQGTTRRVGVGTQRHTGSTQL